MTLASAGITVALAALFVARRVSLLFAVTVYGPADLGSEVGQ